MSAAEASAPKIMLRVGGKASPADSPAPRETGSIGDDNTTDLPQNGSAPRRNPFGGSQASSTVMPNLAQLDRARSASTSVASPTLSTTAVVKAEDGARRSPSTGGMNQAGGLHQNNMSGSTDTASSPHPRSNSMLPPATTTPSLTHFSSYPQSGSQQPTNSNLMYGNHTTGFESKWRQPGKGIL